MFARSSTFYVKPETLDGSIAFVRDEVMSAIMSTPGGLGLSMLVDRDSGRTIVSSSWRSAESREAGAIALEPVWDRVAEVLGSFSGVEPWEVAAMHRERPRVPIRFARVSWLSIDPGMAVTGIDAYRRKTLPAMQDLPGFCSASLFVNRLRGRAVTTTSYDSREAMVAGRGAAESLRTAARVALNADILDVAEFEVALAHLRVPELS